MSLAPNDATDRCEALADRWRRVFVVLRRQVRRQEPSELSIAQISALATVVRQGPISIGQLADTEALPSPAITRLADRLEEAGLVSRRPNPADRRGVLVTATPAGHEVVERREQAGNEWLAKRLRALSAQERESLERAVGILEALAVARNSQEEDEG